MRILLINNFFAPEGGAELSAFQTYQMLKREGHEVAFFATDRKPYFIPEYEYASYFPSYTDFDQLEGLKNKLLHLPKIFYNAGVEKAFKRLVQEFQPDIVHCNNLYYHLTPAVLNVCKLHNLPVVMTMRDVRLMCPAGTLMQSSERYCKEELCVTGSAINCITNKCYGKKFVNSALVTLEYYFRNIHGLYNSIARMIAPSQAIADLAVRAGIAQDRIKVVHNFINDEFFSEKPVNTPGSYFLYVGRLSPEKGVHKLIEAISNLPKDAQLHIAGVGPQEDELRSLAKKLAPEQVTFLGHLSGKELCEAYRNSLALVQPAEWFEVFGRTVVEAAAMGKPAICARSGGMKEIVEYNETGLLFDSENLDDLVRLMRDLYNEPTEAVRLGLNARRKAERHYTSSVHLEKLLQLYQDVITSQAVELPKNIAPVLTSA